MTTIQMPPKAAVGITILSGIWIVVSLILIQNTTDLFLSLVLGLAGFYVAYDQYYKKQNDEQYRELLRMVDSFLNWKMEQENGRQKK